MSQQDDIEGRFGDISGRFGDISGRFGDISGRSIDGIQGIVFEGRLIDELGYLAAKIRRVEKDLIGIAGSFDARLHDLEERSRKPSSAPTAPKPGETKPTP
jgi:hypothetical protein